MLISPCETNSKDRKFYLSYGDKVFELRDFKNSILKSVPTKFDIRDNLSLLLDDILLQSAKNNIDPILVVATIWQESFFNHPKYRTSKKGAKGVMQIMPKTGDYIFKKLLNKDGSLDRNNTSQNIEAGVAYLAYLMKQFNGDEEKSIIAYNMGPNSYIFKRKFKKFNHQYYNKIKAHFDDISRNLNLHGDYLRKPASEDKFSETFKLNKSKRI